MSARPVVLASRPELAHLDIAKRTALVRRRAHRFASGPIRPGNRQRGIRHARRLGLQVRLAPQLPGLAAERTHGRRFGLRRTNRLRPATRALRRRGGELVGSFAFSRPPRLASGWAALGVSVSGTSAAGDRSPGRRAAPDGWPWWPAAARSYH